MVCEAVVMKIIQVVHIKTDNNPANPLTKPVTLTNLKIIEDVFFYQGEV